jgi:antirestriction protein ArdC
MGNNETYAKVTERIIGALESGDTRAWTKPWTASTGRPRSVSSGKTYQGINVLVLAFAAIDAGYASPYWATYKQWGECGAQVRRGEKSATVLLFRELNVEREQDGEVTTDRVPLARAFHLFNAAQVDNVPEKYLTRPASDKTLAGPQEVVDAYLSHGGPKLQYVPGDRAVYHPATDTITLPERGQFRTPEGYYNVAYHECAHSTGAKSRLDRPGITTFDHKDRKWGDATYAREELVAQTGSAMLCAETGVEADPDNDAAYVQSWLKVIKDEPKILVQAASQATRAADLVLEPSRELQKSAEAETVDFEPELVA